MGRPQFSFIVFIIIIAIVLALGSFLALSYLSNRETAAASPTIVPQPGNARIVNVNGTEIQVQVAPGDELFVVQSAEPTAIPPVDPSPTPLPPPNPTPEPTAVSPTATPAPQPVIYRDHTVGQNDTLYSLTRQYATSIALMAVHGLSSDDLTPGQVIRIPVGNPAYCPDAQPYAVGEGDTAFNIARRFNTTAADLRDRNRLNDSYAIQLAQILCVPNS